MDRKWFQENFFDIAFLCIIVIVLAWAMYTSNGTVIDKILLVALGMFKGVPVVKSIQGETILSEPVEIDRK